MGDAMVVDVPKKSAKRKRAELVMSTEEREARIGALRGELDGLFKYYNESLSRNMLIDVDSVKANGSSNSIIACLLEESSLPLSKLVESIFDSAKEKEASLTPASVKSYVLLIGQRSFYGVQNPNADVLEDDSPSCLWCWETRDFKLLPKSIRGAIKIRRTCRKKIQERITAVSAVIDELMKSESSFQKVLKASERLIKVLSEVEIRSLVEKMEQKNGAEVAEKDVKREEKLVVKQLEKNKREAEKEKLRIEKELLKEKLHNEKEMKRLQEEAEKEEKRRENEMKKQLKKQQEEAEREQKRKEKEEAENKKQLALQKQASILERFLKKSNTTSQTQVDQSPVKDTPILPTQNTHIPESVIQSMDKALSLKEDKFDANELWKSHVGSWQKLVNSGGKKRHWGMRLTPKTVVVKELKLTNIEKLVDEGTENENDSKDSSGSGSQKFNRSKQLLQFDKSHRPAFYGYWPKKSEVIKARCPLVKDPELDYEIDSDEEWEEEEPGESLSDCEKDKEEEDENMEENSSKVDEDESEDGFFVPDGYLSENEGVEVERMDHSELVEEPKGTPTSGTHIETEELSLLFKQLKHLNTLTEHALKKNRPFIVFNLMHEKSHSESEQTCLQALSIQTFPVGSPIDILSPNDIQQDEKQTQNLKQKQKEEECSPSSKVVPVASGATITDSDLPEIVSIIQSCPHGINVVVKSLLSKFPNIAKSQLKSKVREISSFTDNRWQIKKDILDKFGISRTPERTSRGTKSIAAFFSKRCLPPTGKTTNPNQVSPQPMEKAPHVEVQNNNTYTN